MAQITVRALDSSGDPLQGNGQNCFLSDLDAVTQIISTRLKLFEGEFWLNLADGTPMFQSILGSPGGQQNLGMIVTLLSQRITGTPYVTGITSLDASFTGRALSYSATVATAFGTVTVTNQPGASAALATTLS